MNTDKMKLAALVMTFAFALAACDKPNSAEKAGREVDRAAEKAGDKLDEASKKLSEQTAKTGEAIEDAAITTKVKTAILAEPGLKVLKINVDTVGGVVTLTGTVDSQANSDKAKQVVGAVSGVKQVENLLIVMPPK
ncbi:MAG: BON domain-containing protein [Pseudomonadota bacterium]